MRFVCVLMLASFFWCSAAQISENPFALSSFDTVVQTRNTGRLCELLKSNQAPPNCLHRIVDFGDVSLLRLALKFYPYPNLSEEKKRTPLHCAAATGNTPMIDLLVGMGAKDTVRDVFGSLPIDKSKDEATAHYIRARIAQEELNQKLATAIRAIDIKRVHELLDCGAQATAYDLQDASKQSSLLHSAAEKGFCVGARALLNAGAKIVTDIEGRTPMHTAAFYGYVDVVKLFATLSVSSDKPMRNGDLPITIAADQGHQHVIEQLQEFLSFNINAQGRGGNTALHIAVNNGNEPLARWLVANGSSVNAINEEGDTPLHIAVYSGFKSLVPFLLRNRALAHRFNRQGFTPLLLAVRCGMYREKLREKKSLPRDKVRQVQELYSEIGKELIDAKADANDYGKFGNCPLHWAVLLGMHSLVNDLLEAGADVHRPGEYGSTPLHLAATTGNVGIAQQLLTAEARVDERNKLGQTPLHLSVENGHVAMTEFLLQHGAGINEPDIHHDLPLQVAVRCGSRREEVCGLLEKGDIRAINKIAEPYVRIAMVLLNSGAGDMTVDRYNNAPLHWAVMFGRHKLVEELLAHGAAVDMQGEYGSQPLHLAALFGWAEIAKILLEAGAAVDADNHCAQTPLFFAVDRSHYDVIPPLVAAGANPFKRDMNGRTPKTLASPKLQGYFNPNRILLNGARQGNVDVMRNALKAGADVNVQDRDGNTPLHLALQSGNRFAVVCLLWFARFIMFDIRNNGGHTVVDVALSKGMLHFIQAFTKLKEEPA